MPGDEPDLSKERDSIEAGRLTRCLIGSNEGAATGIADCFVSIVSHGPRCKARPRRALGWNDSPAVHPL